MTSLKQFCTSIAQGLGNELNMDNRAIETVRFGMEIIVGAIIKGIVVFGMSYIMGILPIVTAALITSGILRLLSGGAHCSSYSRCLLFGTVITLANGLVVKLVYRSITPTYLFLIILLTALFGLIVIKKWAPLESGNKPIKNGDRRKKFKEVSTLFVLFWSLSILLFTILGGDTRLSLGSIGGLAIQVLSVSPYGCGAIHRIDHWLKNIL